MKKLLFIMLIFITSYGCEQDDSVQYSSSLVGKWSWLSTCGGFVGCVRQEKDHNIRSLVFTPDSIYNFYKNDSLINSGRFHTYSLISADGKETTNMIDLGTADPESYTITHDTLTFRFSGFEIIYKRI